MSGSEALCCCEYENSAGEKSHILACCCDCQALDEMVDRCFKCQKIPTSLVDKFLDTLLDRFRIPGVTGGGASRVNLEVATPIIMIPAALTIATVGPITTVLVLLSLPYFCFFFYRTWKRRTKKSRTKFFFVWGLFSLIFMYTVFQYILVKQGEISVTDNLLVTTGVVIMCIALKYAKKDPGIIGSGASVFSGRNSPHHSLALSFGEDGIRESSRGVNSNDSSGVSYHSELSPQSVSEVGYSNSTTGRNTDFVPGPDVRGQLPSADNSQYEGGSTPPDNWCESCRQWKPLRAGHCNVCGVCIDIRDHHCVWIDSCIGSQNHRSFLVAMLTFVLTGYYGSYLTLSSVCQASIDTVCNITVAYKDFSSALCFVSASYVCLVGLIMLVGVVHQVLLISQNLTSQELHRASQYGSTRCFVFVTDNAQDAGLLNNWRKFLTKSRKPRQYEHV